MLQDANEAGGFSSEVNNWRNAVVVVSWVATGLFALTFFIYLGKVSNGVSSMPLNCSERSLHGQYACTTQVPTQMEAT